MGRSFPHKILITITKAFPLIPTDLLKSSLLYFTLTAVPDLYISALKYDIYSDSL